jgi:hypothetical protein
MGDKKASFLDNKNKKKYITNAVDALLDPQDFK